MNPRASNHFDLFRFVAASLVLFSHAFTLTQGNSANEPLMLASHGKDTLGECAVAAFFIMSGYLISASWQAKRKLKPFFAARAARIFPGLILMLAALYLAGACLSDKPIADYLFATPVDFFAKLLLHGRFELTAQAFANNPYPLALNGALWTLRYEVLCYLVLGALGFLALLRRVAVWFLWLLLMALCFRAGGLGHVIGDHPLYSLGAWFVAGMLVQLHDVPIASKTGFGFGLVLIAVALAAGAYPLLMSPFIAKGLIDLAKQDGPLSGFGKFGDFSYGIYIYAFPIEQLSVTILNKLAVPCPWWMCCLVSFPFTLLCAMLSWHLVEKRALDYVRKRGAKPTEAVLQPGSLKELVK